MPIPGVGAVEDLRVIAFDDDSDDGSGVREGAVEKSNHTAAQRWWRTVADDLTVEQAQASLDRLRSLCGDTRMRPTKDGRENL